MLERRRIPHKTGGATVFPYKQRQPISVQLTPEGHGIVARNVKRLGWSRNDFMEALLRQHGDDVTDRPDEKAS